MKSDRIDIMQEFVELYHQEEMLAFFEFSIERPGAAAVNGLCKISKPKAADPTTLSGMAGRSDQPCPEPGRRRERSIERTPAAGPAAGLRYLSLTFIADTPDNASTATVEAALDRLEDDAFKDALPSVEEVVPVPTMTQGAENSIRQFDLMLNARLDPGETFVNERLLPALRSFAGLHASAVVWWDAAAQSPAEGAATPDAAPSILDTLRAYLRRFVDSERT